MNQKIKTQINQTQVNSIEPNKPETKFKAGALSATVWKNIRQNKEGGEFETYSINIDRNYTDKEGNWKSTNSLRTNDLPKAMLVLKKAYEFLVLREQEPTGAA